MKGTRNVIPYGKQWIAEDDIAAVVEVLRSDWLTTGPKVDAFEAAFVDFVGMREAVAVSNGTAALHAAMFALGIGPGDEVVVPAMTFAATANCVLYQGGTPVFADVDPDTLLLDPESVEARITRRTKAIIAVDYAGQPCDYDEIGRVAEKHGLALVADACHSLGATYRGRRVGSLALLNTFSFHPVKHITTGEGGMVTTNDPELAARMRSFRNHGISADFRQRERAGSWYYEVTDLGYNYRVSDIQCALGRSQLRKLPGWIARRREIAASYDAALSDTIGVEPLSVHGDREHGYHLYVVRFQTEKPEADRNSAFTSLRRRGVGVNVHYVPVHLHPLCRDKLGTGPGVCPVAEGAYARILSLPIFPKMTDREVKTVTSRVLDALREAVSRSTRNVAVGDQP